MKVLKRINERIQFAEKQIKMKEKEVKELILLFDGREISKESVIDGRVLIEAILCIYRID